MRFWRRGPRPEQLNPSRRASKHLAQGDPAPCPERVNTSRRASKHLAQSNPAPCPEQVNTSRRARGCSHSTLALRKPFARAARGQNELEKRARVFFFRRARTSSRSSSCQSHGSTVSHGVSSKSTGYTESVGTGAASNSSTESSSRPTRQMSVGMGEYPIGSNALTALRFTSESTESPESEAVETVDCVKPSG